MLRDGEIDLEDSQQYETLFRNYPNHHISHYLLDKMKGLHIDRTRNDGKD